MAVESSGGNGAPTDLRESIIAELSSAPQDAPTQSAATEEVEADSAESTDATGDEVEASGADDAELEQAEESTDGEDIEADADADADAVSDDPKVQKGLDQVRRAEKRSRDRLEADRQTLEAERTQLKQSLAELEAYKALAKRAKFDAAAVLRHLGLNEDDFELAAHSIYAESKAGQADPQRKAAAQARMLKREQEEKYAALEAKQAALEAKIAQQEQQAVIRAEAERYIADINTAAQAKYPLVAHMIKADADETHDALVATFSRLEAQLKRAPKPHEVVAAYDKRERARLTKLGIDPATIVKTPAAKPPSTVSTAKRAAPAKAPANTNGATKPKTQEELRAEILAELSSLS